MMSVILLLSLGSRSPAFANTLYRVTKANQHYTVSRSADVLALQTNGITYPLHFTGCLARQAVDLAETLRGEFERLPKSNRGLTARTGTVEAFGEVRSLKTSALSFKSNRYFDLLPRRFINLYGQERAKCLDTFK